MFKIVPLPLSETKATDLLQEAVLSIMQVDWRAFVSSAGDTRDIEMVLEVQKVINCLSIAPAQALRDDVRDTLADWQEQSTPQRFQATFAKFTAGPSAMTFRHCAEAFKALGQHKKLTDNELKDAAQAAAQAMNDLAPDMKDVMPAAVEFLDSVCTDGRLDSMQQFEDLPQGVGKQCAAFSTGCKRMDALHTALGKYENAPPSEQAGSPLEDLRDEYQAGINFFSNGASESETWAEQYTAFASASKELLAGVLPKLADGASVAGGNFLQKVREQTALLAQVSGGGPRGTHWTVGCKKDLLDWFGKSLDKVNKKQIDDYVTNTSAVPS